MSAIQAAKVSNRLFYALWPDKATSQRLQQLQARVRGRVTHPDDFHLTLVFLGKQSPDLLPAFYEILRALPKPEMTLVLDRLGYFPRKHIAWAGMEAPPVAIFDLQETLTRDLAHRLVPSIDLLDFRPHITLARNADAPSDKPVDPIVWTTYQIALVESLPPSTGPKYRIISAR